MREKLTPGTKVRITGPSTGGRNDRHGEIAEVVTDLGYDWIDVKSRHGSMATSYCSESYVVLPAVSPPRPVKAHADLKPGDKVKITGPSISSLSQRVGEVTKVLRGSFGDNTVATEGIRDGEYIYPFSSIEVLEPVPTPQHCPPPAATRPLAKIGDTVRIIGPSVNGYTDRQGEVLVVRRMHEGHIDAPTAPGKAANVWPQSSVEIVTSAAATPVAPTPATSAAAPSPRRFAVGDKVRVRRDLDVKSLRSVGAHFVSGMDENLGREGVVTVRSSTYVAVKIEGGGIWNYDDAWLEDATTPAPATPPLSPGDQTRELLFMRQSVKELATTSTRETLCKMLASAGFAVATRSTATHHLEGIKA